LENLKKIYSFGDLSVDDIDIVLKLIGTGGSGYGLLVGVCEHRDRYSFSLKVGFKSL
jgi:hypothetical protein